MATGTVKWFNFKKGYGFIQPDSEGEQDVFIHISALHNANIRTLDEGQKVSYEVQTRNDGKQSAVNLAIDEA